jgi:CDGSH-type Zn-finger protein
MPVRTEPQPAVLRQLAPAKELEVRTIDRATAATTPAPRQHAGEQPTIVVARRDASLDVRGELRIYHSDGREMVKAGRVLLCRCGHSANKPFCDSSHDRVGFRSLPAETPIDRLDAETPAAFSANPRVPDVTSAESGTSVTRDSPGTM